jgi:hypothetical protein
MNPTAKTLLIAGLTLVGAGLLWQLLYKYLPLGKLPGDIAIEKPGMRFYFPIVTCLLISILGSVILYFFRKL